TRASEKGFDVAIVSIDKDFFQLVHNGVRVYDPREDGAWFDEAAVQEKFGVQPSRVVDVLALVGDTSDNVAGVPGVGKKGAVDLITTFGSLDALLAGASDLTQRKYREALLAHREDALRSRALVTIRCDVPIDVDVETLRYRGASRERCFELFSRLAFRTLVDEYAPTADTIQKDYGLVVSLPELDALISGLRTAGEFAMRVVTDDPSAMRAGIAGVAFSTADRQARYIPLGHGRPGGGDLLSADTVSPQVDRRAALERLRPLFEDSSVRKVGHDLKADLIVLRNHGVDLAGLAFDSMLASYLLDATRPGHPLEPTSLEHLGYKALTEDDVCGRGAKGVPLSSLTPEASLNFAGERADLARQLSNRLAPLLVADSLDQVFREMEMPLLPVLADIERAGILIDGPALATQSRHIEQELARYTERIYALAGQEFNINSPKQLGEILFDKMQLPALKKTGKTRSASTAFEVLEELALVHELPRLILEWRGLHKLKSTYIDALPQLVHPVTGRVHTSFNQ
ncbi:MAG: DNA polymerase I, partial [Actinobacteria bacterium]